MPSSSHGESTRVDLDDDDVDPAEIDFEERLKKMKFEKMQQPKDAASRTRRRLFIFP